MELSEIAQKLYDSRFERAEAQQAIYYAKHPNQVPKQAEPPINATQIDLQTLLKERAIKMKACNLLTALPSLKQATPKSQHRLLSHETQRGIASQKTAQEAILKEIKKSLMIHNCASLSKVLNMDYATCKRNLDYLYRSGQIRPNQFKFATVPDMFAHNKKRQNKSIERLNPIFDKTNDDFAPLPLYSIMKGGDTNE